MSLDELCRQVAAGETEVAEKLARDLLDKGLDPVEAINTLAVTMTDLGEKFARLEIFLPEIVMAGDAMSAVVAVLRPAILARGGQAASKGKVVLGVVRGDLHVIGKDIVKMMLETAGFEVKDLGADVSAITFIKEAQAMKADFIGASSLMSTTMPGQREIVTLLNEKGLRDQFKVIIGGAPVTQEWADLIKVDLYCPDASGAPAAMTRLMIESGLAKEAS
jgi:corrinoid protein of di/trimethylamine methyltransferase